MLTGLMFIYCSNDVNEAYELFSGKLAVLYNENIPLETIEIRHGNKCKPWITPGLLVSIKRKHRYYWASIKKKTESAINKYKKYKNKLGKLIKTAQKLYFAQRFENVKGDIRRTWQLIKNVIDDSSSSTKSTTVSELMDGSTLVTDPTVIANKFNEYFTHIGPNLAAKISPVTGNYLQYLPSISSTMLIRPSDISEIINIVREFSSSKSPGHDDFSPKVLKAVIQYICEPLCYICNLSFTSGCFPDLLKLAKVIPLFKSEDKKLVVNYRPISVLSVFSKVFEKLMHERLYEFLDLNLLLN